MFWQKVSIGMRAGLVAGGVLGIGARLAMRAVASMGDHRMTEFSVGARWASS